MCATHRAAPFVTLTARHSSRCIPSATAFACLWESCKLSIAQQGGAVGQRQRQPAPRPAAVSTKKQLHGEVADPVVLEEINVCARDRVLSVSVHPTPLRFVPLPVARIVMPALSAVGWP